MKKIIAKIKALLKKGGATEKELTAIEKYDVEAAARYTPPVQTLEDYAAKKPQQTKRKPGPKKAVPGAPAVKKSNAPKPAGTKPRTNNKPKPKVK